MYVQLIKVFINPELLKKLHIKPMEIPKSKKKKSYWAYESLLFR